MKQRSETPRTRVQVTFPSGEVLTREWMMTDQRPDVNVLLPWLDNPRKAWDHPQDPITYKGDVKPEHEDDVRAFLAVPSHREKDPHR